MLKKFLLKTNTYQPKSLRELCSEHYIKRYIKADRTELTTLPNWQLYISGDCYEELCFVMLLCKDNVGF